MGVKMRLIISNTSKYVKGFIMGALFIIALNSYNNIIQVSFAPVMEPLGEFMDKHNK